ncbi:hypothetical protein SA2016_0603 [Sinomonas atrocyanea]|uniref:Uncharacterized protein n=1 Tax=Sinomonas atrocyanea TaxID=37927 RepID=A0A126ZWM3_9MICC|nr:hypothetical protein [Sinomonas atrocyanea]AMM31296.1 hypothetical protein SA2016_0603 [Sinomonas atrocyanea]GEB64493.1 hypothetical protein SAT01_19410 [Sinomonas atrocyanea]GGG64561.1 hypothetical protein GCM10007172_14870 [Sinomonas atrocyanea]
MAVKWLDEPREHNCPAAESYLCASHHTDENTDIPVMIADVRARNE